MIGLDTNVIVRYIVQDDPVQSVRACEIFERDLTPENPGYVSLVALVETAWVLARIYRYSNVQIAGAIERLLGTDAVRVAGAQEAEVAVLALAEGRASFADALISALGARAGCTFTLTFDRAAARLAGFVAA